MVLGKAVSIASSHYFRNWQLAYINSDAEHVRLVGKADTQDPPYMSANDPRLTLFVKRCFIKGQLYVSGSATEGDR